MAKKDKKKREEQEKPKRHRLLGMFSGRKGKAVGFASIAAPIAGFLANDLRKPQGVIRGVIGPAVNRLISPRLKGRKEEKLDEKTDVFD